MTYFIGVDPGKRGAFSVVDDKSKLIDMWRIGELYDMRIKLIPYIDKPYVLLIEKAFAMAAHGRQQGATSMFNYGQGYGELIGMFKTLQFKYHEIHPRSWMMKIFSKMQVGASKQQSKEFCKAMHPDVSFIPKKCRVVHDGLTDATCIAHYARRFLQ
jgi:hypothetical protein